MPLPSVPPSRGADSVVHIELFGKRQLAWFQTFLELPHGIHPTTPLAMCVRPPGPSAVAE
ncbi:hypothetical protein GBAR_LOCUS2450 [Geodia barretti]|uniref:Uncharacterized protein n=1 Tax=Geodia barretti TaxID=519541 RepID=A0AA35W6U9_GEOBA|nr:hypothetical protein GBAR_LOCUS2450 [Geodia barretti]